MTRRWQGWHEGCRDPAARGMADRRVAQRPGASRPTTGSQTSPPTPSPSGSRGWRGMRWKIELDYHQLKGQLGLDHYEGRSWLGWYHHTALVTAAHGFLTLERLRPFQPAAGLTLPTSRAPLAADLQMLDRALSNLSTTSRPRPAPARSRPPRQMTGPNKALLRRPAVRSPASVRSSWNASCSRGERKIRSRANKSR